MVNIENALKIPGFTNEHELRWLAEKASKCLRIAEIGCWKGRSTRAMADNLQPGAHLYAVDTWNGTTADPHIKELQGKPEDWLFNEFIGNIGEDLIACRKVENEHTIHTVRPCRGTSEYYAHYLGGPNSCYKIEFDMIFIDADHSYDAVRADILAWLPALKPGGLFCGHDFERDRGGVVAAVQSVFPKARKVGVGTIWVTE